ncbi:DNA methyltransferase [Desemzia incerta]|uniref:DNA methyltransferase n=1 Tax=Desemzia incerta TaxID=82801 RepID=UPI003D0221CB
MQTKLQSKVEAVLKQFPEYWENESLLKHRVIEDLRNYKEVLINALISDELISESYSIQVGDNKIFKLEDFVSMLRYKNYLDNSYTKYSNEIGLTSEGKYLNYSSDVVLDFPHKDGILEGGMRQENKGKEEVYYHNVLAKEEIDTLLSPKILKNIKKYDKNGIHKTNQISSKDNLIIKGNNLIALHTLKERYAGKVKLIYIDPPYNTGNDSFKYNDRFNHSTWLTFMKNRLEIARKLLMENGVLVVQINDQEMAYLKVLLDEIFSKDNFVSSIVVKMAHLSGVKMAHKESIVPKTKEYLLVYANNSSQVKLNPQYQKADWNDVLNRYTSYINNYDKDYTEWEPISLREAMKINNVPLNNTELVEEFRVNNAERIYQTALNRSANFPKKPQNKFLKHGDKFSLNGREVIFASGKIRENNLQREVVQIVGDIWNDIGINNVFQEGGDGIDLRFGKKPEMLLERIISMFTDPDDIVLDFFAGTGTTLGVSLKLQRQFIGVEQLDYIQDLTIKRLSNVMHGEQSGISKKVNWHGGGSFIYAELFELNQVYIKSIQNASNTHEIEALINIIKNSSFLNIRVDLEKLFNQKEVFFELPLEKQKELLIEILDNNQLYLSYSEIDDDQYAIDNQVKAFNHSFYQEGV